MTNTPGPACCCCCCFSAVAYGGVEVFLVDLKSKSHDYVTLKRHSRSVKSVAFDPAGEYLASAGSDGVVVVWRVDDKSMQVARTFPVAAADAEPLNKSYSFLRPAWHPSGSLLALPSGRDIRLYERGTWREVNALKAMRDSGHRGDVTLLAWAPGGKVLASAGLDNRVMTTQPHNHAHMHTVRPSHSLLSPS